MQRTEGLQSDGTETLCLPHRPGRVPRSVLAVAALLLVTCLLSTGVYLVGLPDEHAARAEYLPSVAAQRHAVGNPLDNADLAAHFLRGLHRIFNLG